MTIDRAGADDSQTGHEHALADHPKVEAALRESEQRFRILFEQSPDAMWLIDPHSVDPSWVIVDCNQAACRMHGYTREELIGRPITMLSAESGPVTVNEAGIERLWRERRHQDEDVHRHKDGHLVFVEYSVTLLTVGGRELMLGIDRDITERKRMAAALEESRAQLAEAERLAHLGSWQWDILTNSVLWSDELYRIFGLHPQEFRPGLESFLDRLHPKDRPRVAATIEASLRNGAPFAYETRFIHSDGSVRFMYALGEVIHDRHGKPVRMIGSAQDITERRQAEEAVMLAKEEAEQADRAKSQFLSRMSHELRTPLHAISGYSELLALTRLDAEQEEYVHTVLKATAYLEQLIDDVLHIGRIEEGRFALRVEHVDVHGVIVDAIELVAPLASAQGITLDCAVGDGASLAIHADAKRLMQVLVNLLSNAVKYNRPDGTVCITCTSADNRVRIGVSDTGPGIPTEQLPRLFTAFERLDAEQRGIEGTGLGLYLSRLLIEKMDGRISVDSVVDQGSTFWVELPAASSQ